MLSLWYKMRVWSRHCLQSAGSLWLCKPFFQKHSCERRFLRVGTDLLTGSRWCCHLQKGLRLWPPSVPVGAGDRADSGTAALELAWSGRPSACPFVNSLITAALISPKALWLTPNQVMIQVFTASQTLLKQQCKETTKKCFFSFLSIILLGNFIAH